MFLTVTIKFSSNNSDAQCYCCPKIPYSKASLNTTLQPPTFLTAHLGKHSPPRSSHVKASFFSRTAQSMRATHHTTTSRSVGRRLSPARGCAGASNDWRFACHHIIHAPLLLSLHSSALSCSFHRARGVPFLFHE